MTTQPIRALAILVAAVLLSGCYSTTPQPPPDPPELLDEEEIFDEYWAETERLQLAPGDDWEVRPHQLTAGPGDPDESIMFEPGVGAQTAQLQWYCSWASAALTDDDLRDVALARLEEFPTLSVWRYMDHHGHALFEGIQARAALGDFDALADYVRNNCVPKPLPQPISREGA